jgi:hypothetical protein
LGVEPIFLSDFFTGALRMTGPYNSDTAISGLYNPWWDAILLLKAQHKDANKWNFVSFVLMSGEDFRKESANTIPAFDSVVASKGPQALAWMKLIKKTREVFNKTFASGNVLTEKFDDKVLKSSLKPMMLRAALRMKLHQDVLTAVITLDKEDADIVSYNIEDIQILFKEKYGQKTYFWNTNEYQFRLFIVDDDISAEEGIELIRSIIKYEK